MGEGPGGSDMGVTQPRSLQQVIRRQGSSSSSGRPVQDADDWNAAESKSSETSEIDPRGLRRFKPGRNDDMEEGEEEEEEDDDGDDEVIGGGCMVARESDFATAELEQVMHGLNKWPWMAYPASVASCLEQACRMLAPELRDRVARDRASGRSTGVQRAVLRKPSAALRAKLDTLFHEGAPGVMDKCLDDRAIHRWPDNIHRLIFEAFLRTCDAVVMLASALLTSADSQASSSVAEVALLEQDLKPLLVVLAMGFNKSSQYHDKHMEEALTDLPWEVSSRFAVPEASFKPETNGAGEWFCLSRREQVSSADNCSCGSCCPIEHYVWLAAFLDYFGQGTYGNGFEVFAALFAKPERLSISLLEALFKPLAHAADMLTQEVGERMVEPCKATLEFIETKLTSNVDALSDGSRDGSYQALSMTLRHAHRLLTVGLPAVEAERAVSRVQRQLVESMLQFVSFNKQLSAVREINRLLEAARDVKAKDAGAAVETAIGWMKDNDIIERVLRSNLHHKQYVDQVERMMRFLLEEQRLSDEHLDTIWAATEKPDQFEAVKNNIYDLIADLASSFSDQQLDTLFNRFQHLQGRPLADIVKILQLTKKLAQSDTKGVMAARLLELLWSISLHAGPDASAHALESHALADILGHYASVNCASKEAFMDRCLQMVTQGKCVVSSLQLLKDIIMLEPPAGAPAASPGETLDDTDAGTVPGAVMGVEGAWGVGQPVDTPSERVRHLVSDRNLEQTLVTCIANFQQQARNSAGTNGVSTSQEPGAHTAASSMCDPQGTAPADLGNSASVSGGTPAATAAGTGVADKQTVPQRALPRVSDGGRLYTHEKGLRARLSFLLWAMQTANAELSEASVDTLWGELVEWPAAPKDRDLALAWLSEALGAAGAGATGFSAAGLVGPGDTAMQLDSPPAGSGSLKNLGFNPSLGDADAPVVLGAAAQGVVLDRLAKLAPGEFTSCAWGLFYKLFLAVNIQAETVTRYMQAVGPAAVAAVGSVDQIRGLECIWNLAVLSPNPIIAMRCATVLCDLYSCLIPGEQVDTVATRCKFVEECMQRLDSTPTVHQGAVRLHTGAHLEEATDSCGREEGANNGAAMGAREEEVEEGEADRTRPVREGGGAAHAEMPSGGLTPGVPVDSMGIAEVPSSGGASESGQEAQGMEVETGSPRQANGTHREPAASASADEPMEDAAGAAGRAGAVPAPGSAEPQAGRALPLKKRLRESGGPEAQIGVAVHPGAGDTGTGRLPARKGARLGTQECARVVQCLHLLKQFISKCEGRMQRNTQPHGASFLGPSFTLHVSWAGPKTNQRIPAKVHTNESLGSFRQKVVRNYSAPGGRVRLLCDGHELLHDWMTLRQLGLSSDKNVIAAPIHPHSRVEEDAPPPPEVVREREAEMPGVIMSQQPRTYEVLFTLLEMPEPAVHEAADDVLMLLPTQPAVLRGFQGLGGRQGQTLQEDALALQRMLSPGPRLPYILQVLDGLLIPVNSRPSPKTWRLRSRFLRLGGLQRLIELIGPRGIPGVTNRARRACYLCCLHILRLYLAPGQDSEEAEPEAEAEEGEDTEEEGEAPIGPRPSAGEGKAGDRAGEGATQGVPVGDEERREGGAAGRAEGAGHAAGMDDEADDVDVETHEEDDGRGGPRASPSARLGSSKGRGAGARVESSGPGAGVGVLEEEEVVTSFGSGVGHQRVQEVMTEEFCQRLVQALLALSWASALGHIQAMDEEYPLALDLSAGGVPKRASEEVNDTAQAQVGGKSAHAEGLGANGTRRGGIGAEEEGDEVSTQAGTPAPAPGGARPSGRPGYTEAGPGDAMEEDGNQGSPADGDEDEEDEEEEEEDRLSQTGEGKLHEDDDTIAHEAFDLLSWCLKTSMGPALTAYMFSLPLIDKFIVDTVLLSPSYGLRRLFGEFLLVQSRAANSVKHVVFRALVAFRDAANQHPAQCQLFFELLKHVLALLGPADEHDLCRQLLVEEAEWVRAQAANPEALASLTRFQRTNLLDAHLVLLQELVVRAGTPAAASLALSPPHGQGLISVLLARFLFPELPAGAKDAARDKDGKLQQQVELMLHRLQLSLSSPHLDAARTSTSTGATTNTGTPSASASYTSSTSTSAGTSISVLTAASSGRGGGGAHGAGQWLPEFGVLGDTLSDTATFEATCQAADTRFKAFSLLNVLCMHSPEAVKEVASLLMPLHFDPPDLIGWDCLPLLSHRPHGTYLGLKNAGATCYMNAVFQQLYMQPQVRRAVLGCPITAQEESKDCVLYQVQDMFASLLASDEDHYTPKGFWEAFKDYDGQPVNLREHQDAFEFFNRLYDLLDERLKKQPALPRAPQHAPRQVPGPGVGVGLGVGAGAGEAAPKGGAVPTLTSIFGGVFSQQVICKTCPHRSEREEPFAAVSVDVMNKKGLEDSLAAFVRGDLLEADNAYFCEACGVKVDALKRACVKALPPSLIIHLKRFDFDYETMQRLKLKDRFEFPSVLNMMPYTVEGLTLAELRAAAAEAAAKGGPQAAPARASGPGAGAAGSAEATMATPDVGPLQKGAALAAPGSADQRQATGVPGPAGGPSASPGPGEKGEQGPAEGAGGAGSAPGAVVHRRSGNVAGVSVPSVLEVQREAAGGCPADEEETEEDGACLSEGNNSLGLGKLGLEGQNAGGVGGAEKGTSEGTPERGALEVDQGAGVEAAHASAKSDMSDVNGILLGNETGVGTKMDVDSTPPLPTEALPAATPVQKTAGSAAAGAPAAAPAGAEGGAGAGGAVADPVSEDQKLLESVGLRMRDSGYYQYRLVGVVVHSGTAFAGHYYSYIKERDGDRPLHTRKPRKSRWWSFDDRKVERYDIKNLERDCFGGKHSIDSNDSFLKSSLSQEYDRPNSAYMLFYERDYTSDFPQPKDAAPSVSTTSAPKPATTSRGPKGEASMDTCPVPGGLNQGRTTGKTPAVEEESSPAQATARAGIPRANSLALRAHAPYILPKKIHLEIWRENLRMVKERNLLDRSYFGFVLSLVANNLDGSLRHTERKKMAALEDPPGAKPSPQRCEALVVGREADETAHSLVDLVLAFLCRVYFHAHSSLREDVTAWTTTVCRLLESNETACQLFNLRLASHRPWVSLLLIKCPSEDIRNAMASMVSTSLQVSVRLLNGQGEALEPAVGAPPDALGVDALLETILGVMRDVGNVSGHYISQYFKLLIEFFHLGPAQQTQLLVKGAVQKTVTILEKLLQMMQRKFDLRQLFLFLSLILRASDLSSHFEQRRPYRPVPRTRIATATRRRRPGGAVHQGPSGAQRGAGVPRAVQGGPKGRTAGQGSGEQGSVGGDGEGERGDGAEDGAEAKAGAEEWQGEGQAGASGKDSEGGEGEEGGEEEEEEEGEEAEELVVQELVQPPYKIPGPSVSISPEAFKFLSDKNFHTSLVGALYYSQELVYLYSYLSFCSDTLSIAILRELMDSLLTASTSETRALLPVLAGVMDVNDCLQTPRQDAIFYGHSSLHPITPLIEMLFLSSSKNMNSMKRYCVLKFVLGQFNRYPHLIGKVPANVDLAILLHWLNKESVGPQSRGTPGGSQVFAGTNDENTSNRIRRTTSVERAIAQLRRILSTDDPGSPPSDGPPPARGSDMRGPAGCDE